MESSVLSPSDRPQFSQPVLRVVESTISLAAKLLTLPGVASADWCERAARLLVTETGMSAAGVVIAQLSHTSSIEKTLLSGFSGNKDICLALPTMIDAFRRHPSTFPTLGSDSLISQAVTGSGTASLPWTQVAGLCTLGASSIAAADSETPCRRAVIVLLAQGPQDRLQIGASDVMHRAHAAASALATIVKGFGSPEIAWVTPREQQVLELLVLGFSVREIGEKLGRSPHTVHDYVKSMHRKLNASNRGALVARALGYHRFSNVEIKPMAHDESETVS
jgi:DNA-binding CsgD family transcriptional regulator